MVNDARTTRRPHLRCLALLTAIALLACGPLDPPPATGGTTIEPTACGRGLVVVSSDYQSTNVSLVDNEAKVLSSSFLSSASSDAALASALSGDVVPPTAAITGDELVLIDRYPGAVISWVNVRTAKVRAQLNVTTGFASNPQDYLPIAANKAYVTRLGTNAQAGSEPFDGGDDILIIDPSRPEIVGRIPLSDVVPQAGFHPRASRMVAHGARVFVLLGMQDLSFSSSLAARLVTIDSQTDTIESVLQLDGMKACAGLAIHAPSSSNGSQAAARLAIACSGEFGGASTPDTSTSGLVVLSAEDGQAKEISRMSAAALVDKPLGWWLDFVDDDRLLVHVFGAEASATLPTETDAIIEVDLANDSSRVVLESKKQAFTLGDVRCAAVLPEPRGSGDGCGQCFVTDAEEGVLHVLGGSPLQVIDSVAVDSQIGLPPRYLGRF